MSPVAERKPKLPLSALRVGPAGSVAQIPAPRLTQQCSVDSSEDSMVLESPSPPAQTQAGPNNTAGVCTYIPYLVLAHNAWV